MYSAALGRFLQRDPAGYLDSLNPYDYCYNDPAAAVDPLGLAPQQTASTSVLNNFGDALAQFTGGSGKTTRLSDDLIYQFKNLQSYQDLLYKNIPTAIKKLLPTQCNTASKQASARDSIAKFLTVALYNYNFNLNTTVGTLDFLGWDVTCDIGSGAADKCGCCDAHATNCKVTFTLDKVYQFAGGGNALLAWIPGKPYRILNTWVQKLPDISQKLCP